MSWIVFLFTVSNKLSLFRPDEFAIGNSEMLNISIRVANNREDAFEAAVYISEPKGMLFKKFEPRDNASCSIRKVGENNFVKCDIGNPLPMHEGVSTRISFLSLESQNPPNSITNLQIKQIINLNFHECRYKFGFWRQTNLKIWKYAYFFFIYSLIRTTSSYALSFFFNFPLGLFNFWRTKTVFILRVLFSLFMSNLRKNKRKL